MTRTLGIAAILAASQLWTPLAGQALAPEILALSRASRQVRQTVAALANCACLQSMTRSRVSKKGKAAENDRDTLQIEVTMIGKREWFSWPGREDAFVENPGELVGYGLISTGQFTSDLKTVFLDGFAGTHFRGATTLEGRPALKFDYSVSSVFTHYSLEIQGASTLAGMKGSFWIDAKTAELLALSSEATEIPPDFEIRSARTEVIYAPMYLNGDRVVLPQTASIVMEERTGAVSRNHVEFSHCHAYSSASSIVFDDAGSPAAAPETPPPRDSRPRQPIPGRLSLPLRLRTRFTAHTAIGERFSATVDADVRSHGKTIVKKGAEVSGRVRWIEATKCPMPCLAVAIELLEVMGAEGTSYPVYASLRQVEPESEVTLDITRVSQKDETMAFGGQQSQTSMRTIRIPEIPGVGSFFVVAPRLTTPPDMLMIWTTGNPRR